MGRSEGQHRFAFLVQLTDDCVNSRGMGYYLEALQCKAAVLLESSSGCVHIRVSNTRFISRIFCTRSDIFVLLRSDGTINVHFDSGH